MNESNMSEPTATNLEQLDAMTDEMIDTSDIPPLQRFFCHGTLVDAAAQG